MAAFPLPNVQGFNFIEDGVIANLDKVKKQTGDREWNNLLACILSDGDKLFSTTRGGRNHPVQTESLRVDYQGEARESTHANQQAQIGGADRYERKKGESTSISCVHVSFDCSASANIKNALKQAHDYSFKTGRVVVITRAAPVDDPAPIVAPAALTTICTECDEQQDLPSWASSGKKIPCVKCKKYFSVA